MSEWTVTLSHSYRDTLITLWLNNWYVINFIITIRCSLRRLTGHWHSWHLQFFLFQTSQLVILWLPSILDIVDELDLFSSSSSSSIHNTFIYAVVSILSPLIICPIQLPYLLLIVSKIVTLPQYLRVASSILHILHSYL